MALTMSWRGNDTIERPWSANKILAHCFRQDGLVSVYRKLMRHTGTIINLRAYPQLEGLPYAILRRSFADAVIAGWVRDGAVEFHPADGDTLRGTDHLMVIAEKHTHRTPPRELLTDLEVAEDGTTLRPAPGTALEARLARWVEAGRGERRDGGSAGTTAAAGDNDNDSELSRILICGWRTGIVDAIIELDHHVSPHTHIVILDETPVNVRVALLDRRLALRRAELRNITVKHVQGTCLSRTDITYAIGDLLTSAGEELGREAGQRRGTEAAAPPPPPHVIHVLAVGNQDQRNLYSVVSAMDVCRELGADVGHLVLEARDRNLGQQVLHTYPQITYVSSSELMALLTSQVVEYRQLNAVWTELLSSNNSDGSAVYMKNAGGRGAGVAGAGGAGAGAGAEAGAGADTSTTFNQLAEAARLKDEVLIGWKVDGEIHINPPAKDASVDAASLEKIVVIARQHDRNT